MDRFQQSRHLFDNFRFERSEVEGMAEHMLPKTMGTKNGTRWTALEGMCVVLRKLAFPMRLDDLSEPFFWRSSGGLSEIHTTTLVFVSIVESPLGLGPPSVPASPGGLGGRSGHNWLGSCPISPDERVVHLPWLDDPELV